MNNNSSTDKLNRTNLCSETSKFRKIQYTYIYPSSTIIIQGFGWFLHQQIKLFMFLNNTEIEGTCQLEENYLLHEIGIIRCSEQTFSKTKLIFV